MRISWLTVFADVPAPAVPTAVRFWESVTGSAALTPRGEQHELIPLDRPGEDTAIWVQQLQDGRPRWHLDLMVDDRNAAVAEAVALGASTVRATAELVTLSSPAGLPFCLLAATGERRRPAPVRWPDGHRSLLDQICIDIPADRYDAEASFWAALTGWPRHRGDLPEFERLVRPDHAPLRILLQRLGPDDAGAVRAHVDLSSDDVAAEQRRHEALGATLVHEAEHWTTLDDPAGLRYCITDRVPQ